MSLALMGWLLPPRVDGDQLQSHHDPFHFCSNYLKSVCVETILNTKWQSGIIYEDQNVCFSIEGKKIWTWMRWDGWCQGDVMISSTFQTFCDVLIKKWTCFTSLYPYVEGAEEVWSSNNHVLEVLQWQTSIVVQVGLVDHLLTHHPHLVLSQLVAGQLV